MLKGVPRAMVPALYEVLWGMDHGEEIVLADQAFPEAWLGERVIRCEDCSLLEVLEAILPLFPLDTSNAPVLVMAASQENMTNPPSIWRAYQEVVRAHVFDATITAVEPGTFRERSKNARAIVRTGGSAPLGSIILRKGTVCE